MRLDPSCSAGLGGCGPAGNSLSVGSDSSGVTIPFPFVRCVSIVLTPAGEYGSPNWLCNAERRRSASMSRTDSPRCAKETPRFAATVVLRSVAMELTTAITFGCRSGVESRIEVLSPRKASAACERGLFTSMGTVAPGLPASVAPFRRAANGFTGMLHSTGSPVNVSSSEEVLTVSSNDSVRNASSRPVSNPPKSPMAKLARTLGSIGGALLRIELVAQQRLGLCGRKIVLVEPLAHIFDLGLDRRLQSGQLRLQLVDLGISGAEF